MTPSPLQARHRARCLPWVQTWLAPVLPAGRSRSSSTDEATVATCPGGQGETVMGQTGRLLGEEALEMGLTGCRWVGSGAVDEKGLHTSIPEGPGTCCCRVKEPITCGPHGPLHEDLYIPLQPWGTDRHMDVISFPVCLVGNNSHPNQWQQRLRHHGDIGEGSGL